MPTRPPRICNHPGCPVLVQAGYCKAHEPVREKDASQAKFYGSTRWKRLRRAVRSRDPICRMCGYNASTQAHHLDGDWQNNDPANLAGICDPCHARESGKAHHAKRRA